MKNMRIYSSCLYLLIFILIYNISFAYAASNKALSLVNTNIKNNQVNVNIDFKIQIKFDSNIKKSSAFNKISLKSNLKNLDLLVSIEKNVLTAKPKLLPKYSTDYIFTIPVNALKDESYNINNSEIKMHFKTINKNTKSSTPIPTPIPTSNMEYVLNNFIKSVTPDEGSRVNGSVPYALRLDDGRIRLYYQGREGIKSSISTDGLNFTQEDGVRIDGGINFTAIKTADGRIRAYYNRSTVNPVTGWQIHKVYSAISDDGLTFTEEGLSFELSSRNATYASVPEAILTPEGRTRLYYITDNLTGKVEDANKSGVGSSVSDDGKSFTLEPGDRIKGFNFPDPSIIMLPSGYYLLFNIHNQPPLREYTEAGLYASISSDGVNFSKPVLVIPDKVAQGITDPCVFKMSDDTYRVYYWRLNDFNNGVISAIIKVDPKIISLK